MKRRIAGTGLVLAISLTVAFYALATWHPSRTKWPKQGIDVSHHQGTIDWKILPEQGVNFAYIKATEGGDYTDPRFAENWRAAHTAGIARGAYHFFTLCRPGAEQAANFIATVPRDADMLSPALDLEFLGNCVGKPSRDEVFAQIISFVSLVEAHFGKTVTLYLTREFDEAYGISARLKRPLWLRRIAIEPVWAPRPWSMWQASNFRLLHGVNGRVDWNVAQP